MGMDSKLTSKCQTTIPLKIRKYLNIGPGDRIGYKIVDGSVLIVPKNLHAADVTGILKRKGQKPVSIEDMNETIGMAAIERYERSNDRS